MANLPHCGSGSRRVLQRHRAGEPPDKRTPLALAWRTSSLGMFASRLRKLGRRHTTTPEEPKWKILEEQLQEEMATGRSPSTIKTVLSAATWAVSMGIAKHTVPKFFCMSREQRTPRMTGRSYGHRSRPCRQWLPRPSTLPSGRWRQQRYRQRWRDYASERWRGSRSEDWTESEARSRSRMRRSTAERAPREWGPGRSDGSGSYAGGQSESWAAPSTTKYSVGRASWNRSWPSYSQGQSGRRSAGMDGADSARQPCTRQEPPCLASRRGVDGGPHKRPKGVRSARKKGQSNLSPNGPERQIRSARTCSQRGHPELKSTMSGQRDCSPTTFSAIATTAMTSESAAQVPRGAVAPRPDPADECPRRSAVGGQGPKLVGRSPDGW